MSLANAPLLLDTNILIHFVRGQALATRIEERFQLRSLRDRPLISIVTVGEARSLARQLGWAEPKIAALEQLPRDLVVDDDNNWIAACAAASNATLVSSDRDFEPLADRFIR